MKKFGREKPKTITSMQQGVVVNAGVEKNCKRPEVLELQREDWNLKLSLSLWMTLIFTAS